MKKQLLSFLLLFFLLMSLNSFAAPVAKVLGRSHQTMTKNSWQMSYVNYLNNSNLFTDSAAIEVVNNSIVDALYADAYPQASAIDGVTWPVLPGTSQIGHYLPGEEGPNYLVIWIDAYYYPTTTGTIGVYWDNSYQGSIPFDGTGAYYYYIGYSLPVGQSFKVVVNND